MEWVGRNVLVTAIIDPVLRRARGATQSRGGGVGGVGAAPRRRDRPRSRGVHHRAQPVHHRRDRSGADPFPKYPDFGPPASLAIWATVKFLNAHIGLFLVFYPRLFFFNHIASLFIHRRISAPGGRKPRSGGGSQPSTPQCATNFLYMAKY